MIGSNDYGNPFYWDERYSSEDGKTYDWYNDYEALKIYIQPYLRKNIPDFEILIPGCGNSKLGHDLYMDGLKNITNIDISSVVINQMSDRYSELDDMEYTNMDARNMEYIPEGCFDLIIDKGLFDSQLCCSDNMTGIEQLLKEMYRVLKPGGIYCIISHGPPDGRLRYLTRGVRWAVEGIPIPKTPVNGLDEEGSVKNHYLYTCKKLNR